MAKLTKTCHCGCGRTVEVDSRRNKHFTLSDKVFVFMIAHSEFDWSTIVSQELEKYITGWISRNAPKLEANGVIDELVCRGCNSRDFDVDSKLENGAILKCKRCGLEKFQFSEAAKEVMSNG